MSRNAVVDSPATTRRTDRMLPDEYAAGCAIQDKPPRGRPSPLSVQDILDGRVLERETCIHRLQLRAHRLEFAQPLHVRQASGPRNVSVSLHVRLMALPGDVPIPSQVDDGLGTPRARGRNVAQFVAT
jgi:hypothetical protein